MIEVEKGSKKHLLILIVTTAIVYIIINFLADLFVAKFLTNSEFIYSTSEYIFEPIILSVIIGTTLWVIEKQSIKDSKK